jgi:hypothetical protein
MFWMGMKICEGEREKREEKRRSRRGLQVDERDFLVDLLRFAS